MKNTSFRNNQPIDNKIVTDRCFLYGDGVFTTIAINQGKACFLQQHLQRLEKDCQRLKIGNFSQQLAKEALVAAINQSNKAVARLTVSRSSGERGYLCKQAEPVYWVSVTPWPEHVELYREQGIMVRMCQQQLSLNPSLAGVKHCNRLEQVLARNEWDSDSFQEGLMLDATGSIIEGTMSNLFIVKNEQLVTPKLTLSGVAGIMRATVMELANHLDINCNQAEISLEDLVTADAIFVTNSIIGIWPIKQLEKQRYNSHRIILQLQSELNKLNSFC